MTENVMVMEPSIRKRLPAEEAVAVGTTNPNLAESEEETVTPVAAGESPRMPVVRHPLEHSWTFWFDNPSAKSKHAAWGSSIRPVHTFSTIEDFWGLYNNIHKPSKLGIGADFHCFKHGIEPKWEDPLLAMLGEQFDQGDEICGAVVNIRAKQEKISIWTKNGLNEVAQMSIGKQWKECLDYNDTIGFILHLGLPSTTFALGGA
ncbi:hypothetical protein HPP92_000232 [Vanilla planifolia]|uniref:eIF-4F 25 kDa subunit n=1 Tax=Vanilla planifolia TaxID=51239 RepID=A0A835RVT9_VANPL|nr:hypothetical protein HPP92_000232 [Vanilla planifolia]